MNRRIRMLSSFAPHSPEHLLALCAVVRRNRPHTFLCEDVEKTVEVGGAAMFPSKNIVENALNSERPHDPRCRSQGRGLVDTLEVKALHSLRSDERCVRQAAGGTVPNLLKPENKAQLKNVLTYHVVAGKYAAATLAKKQGQRRQARTEDGRRRTGSRLKATTLAAGGASTERAIRQKFARANQSNIVIHVINGMLFRTDASRRYLWRKVRYERSASVVPSQSGGDRPEGVPQSAPSAGLLL